MRVDSSAPSSHARRLLDWYDVNARTLPWRSPPGTPPPDPYRVWLSEIMLQQTQVVTVLEYYERFLQRFPDVAALAAASQDEVLGLWSGLGYYSRARNLHRCAQVVVERHGGRFPESSAALLELPGIGRSTAGAILSQACGARHAIVDGNVKRVLTRVWAYGADLSVSKNEKVLWQMAEEALPTQQIQTAMPRYSQGLMDLGATICLPRKPLCESCPVRGECQANALGEPEKFPVKTRKIKRSSEA